MRAPPEIQAHQLETTYYLIMHIRLVAAFFTFLSLFPAIPASAANPQVELKTNFGNITIELYPDKAPKTVENFVGYVKDGYYNGTIFHRVIPGFMIQGGGFDKSFKQKPTRPPVQNEAANGLKNEVGTVAMARTSDPHSASSQFFINVANNSFLNHTAPTAQGYGYTVFGRVTKGMDIVNKIAGTPTGSGGMFPADVPRQTVIIEEAKLVSN
jgi:peptidyl-prolyl cis-trans isomerase A (cyclophilin A)/peptidyl-prolyl cis-trans isomerase B (cyclophilin B)